MSASTPAASTDSDTAPELSFKGLFPTCKTAGDPPHASPGLLHRTLTERLLFADDLEDDDDELPPVLQIPAATRAGDSTTFSIDSCETTSENTRDSADWDAPAAEASEAGTTTDEDECIVRVPRSCSADPAGGPAAKFAAVAALHSLPASPCLVT